MKQKSNKVYGTDLLQELRELEKKQKTHRNKVIKRFRFLLDNTTDPYLEGFYKDGVDGYSTDMMLFIIIRVEANYVAKSTQTELFETK